ncbi:PQQ-binding-like beta-propeller repeat protein [Gordonia sp. Z-3]|uniref:outer membrane protein assembly factor BamB family protein n=1 Tax=Gordonia sp. Z-3 TaxID=3115408 RepID=UPI002E2A726B|nr:PQQ-binding-like beta-propeller repeat protein [Gordonia sp. Z-3]MED5803049.1 PQQ-binding-like beta-propeller repeat protein [Gordonia sp. Z-3]
MTWSLGPPPPPPRQRSSRLPWLVGGLVFLLVIALGALSLVWFTHRSSPADDSLLAGQLTRSFPTAPNPSWTVTAEQAGGDQFVSGLASEGQYGALGAVTDGQTIVTIVGGPFTTLGPSHRVVGVDASTGTTWRLDRTVRGCSDTIVDHSIACRGDSDVYFIDTRTGNLTATVSLPISQSSHDIAYNGSAAFLHSYSSTDRTTTFYKVTPEGLEWQRSVVLPERFPGSGDASTFTATADLVASASVYGVVISADDGRVLLNRAASWTIARLPDGALGLVTGQVSNEVVTNRTVTVVCPDGTVYDTPGGSVVVPQVAVPEQQNRVLVDTDYVDLTDGRSLWTTDSASGERFGAAVLGDNRELIVVDLQAGDLVALSADTGAELWRSPISDSYRSSGFAVTDGERIIATTPDGGLAAVDLATGAPVWVRSPAAIGNASRVGDGEHGPVLTFAAGDHLVTVTATTITGFAATGGTAVVPGTPRSESAGPGGAVGGDQYVTPCGTPPIFTPQSFRTSPNGLDVEMTVTAQCSGGDVLYGPRTRISITDGGHLVASGTFDLAPVPVVVPPPEGAGSATTIVLTYPPGTFFRLPDTLSPNGDASTTRFLVECDPGVTSGVAPRLSVRDVGRDASPVAATGPLLPDGADPSATSIDALRLQADSDRAFILANLNNRWVAQLSSKRPGLVADGRTWDSQAILEEFLALRLRFKDARLLYSDEWNVFSYRGWWVTVAAVTFPGPDAANNWCRTEGFDPDHCFAKLVSTTAGPDASTKYWG